MTRTRPTGEQLRFVSSRTGEHILDTYLELAERGDLTLAQLLAKVFDVDGNVTLQAITIWRDEWDTGEAYNVGDVFRYSVDGQQQIYIVTQAHTSSTIAADLASDFISLMIDDTVDVMSAVGLPSRTGHGNKYLRVTADASGYEYRTAAEMRVDLAVPALVGNNTFVAAKETFQVTDETTTVSPIIANYRHRATPATGNAGAYAFEALNASSVLVTLARIRATFDDITAGSEDGSMLFESNVAGSVAARFTLTKGLRASSLNDPILGGINATQYLLNNVSVFAADADFVAQDSTVKAVTPANLAARPRFRAMKATNQTGILPSTPTKITFVTEHFDIGGYYNTSNSRWTPPAGPVAIYGVVANSGGNALGGGTNVYVYKNGSAYHGTQTMAAADDIGVSVFLIDEADGDDFYEIYYTGSAVDNDTIQAGAATYFMGWQL